MNNARAWLTIRAPLAISTAAALLWAGAVTASANAQTLPGKLFVPGSRGVASVEPPVTQPSITPCIVTLFEHEAFDHRGEGSSMAAHAHLFRFAPPRGCPGEWEKVVLEADFSVPAGRQFDRTAAIWLGGVNLYFGTTLEPEPDLARHWHATRDLTDYSTLFRKERTGQIILNNWISATTNQPIYVTARLLFYPHKPGNSAPAPADHIYPMSSDPTGEQQALNLPQDIVSRRFTFPRNVENAYLDLIAQSQAHDERWYTCVDKRFLKATRDYSLEAFEACDGGSFRGVEVLVDEKPAGLAPVYPWIFAGGIAPHLWLPTPGIQATNFIPFRVDLTPFAGLLDDGKPHTVSVRVLGANRFFNVAANLLLYQDHQSAPLHGKLLDDTLSQAQPALLTVRNTLHSDRAGHIVGMIRTHAAQSYLIRGLLQTPRGNLITTVCYREDFRNDQTFDRPGARRYDETIQQITSVLIQVHRTLNGRLQNGFVFKQQDPFSLAVRKTMVTTGQDFIALVAVQQGHEVALHRTKSSGGVYKASLEENLSARDRAYGKAIPPPLDRSNFDHEESGQETVRFNDSLGSCYQAKIVSREERIVALHEGKGCPDRSNRFNSRSLPDNPWLMPLQP